MTLLLFYINGFTQDGVATYAGAAADLHRVQPSVPGGVHSNKNTASVAITDEQTVHN